MEKNTMGHTIPNYQSELAECQRQRDALAEVLEYPRFPGDGMKNGVDLLYVIGQRLMELDEKGLAKAIFKKADKEKEALAMLDDE